MLAVGPDLFLTTGIEWRHSCPFEFDHSFHPATRPKVMAAPCAQFVVVACIQRSNSLGVRMTLL